MLRPFPAGVFLGRLGQLSLPFISPSLESFPCVSVQCTSYKYISWWFNNVHTEHGPPPLFRNKTKKLKHPHSPKERENTARYILIRSKHKCRPHSFYQWELFSFWKVHMFFNWNKPSPPPPFFPHLFRTGIEAEENEILTSFIFIFGAHSFQMTWSFWFEPSFCLVSKLDEQNTRVPSP